jgi:hypothetical protein
LLEESIVENMSASVEQTPDVQQPIDSIVYNTFVEKFNEEYSEVLNENQKQLLNNYISSFTDNGLEMKVYLNEEIGRLKEKLITLQETEDLGLKEKFGKVYNILESTKDEEISVKTLEIVLNTQELLEDIEDGD